MRNFVKKILKKQYAPVCAQQRKRKRAVFGVVLPKIITDV